MTAINNTTRAAIKGYLEGFIDGLVDEYKGRKILKPDNATEYLSRYSSNGELKPFQAALIPPELIRINQFE
ncbi:MAG: TdeIII family type II restriction endonuclease, partial [Dolichospermum sp.]